MKHPAITVTLTLALCVAAPWSRATGSHAGGHDDSAIGEPGKAARITRTVQIDMTDSMRFNPASIPVKQGETTRFVFRNSGRDKHELVLGAEKEFFACLQPGHYEAGMNGTVNVSGSKASGHDKHKH